MIVSSFKAKLKAHPSVLNHNSVPREAGDEVWEAGMTLVRQKELFVGVASENMVTAVAGGKQLDVGYEWLVENSGKGVDISVSVLWSINFRVLLTFMTHGYSYIKNFS